MDAKYIDNKKEETRTELKKFANALNNLLKTRETITQEDETRYKLILLDLILNNLSLYEEETSDTLEDCFKILRKNDIPGVYVDSLRMSVTQAKDDDIKGKTHYEIINQIQTLHFLKEQIIEQYYRKFAFCC